MRMWKEWYPYDGQSRRCFVPALHGIERTGENTGENHMHGDIVASHFILLNLTPRSGTAVRNWGESKVVIPGPWGRPGSKVDQ
jgi:hypothetical protein